MVPPQLGNLSKLHYLDLSSFHCDTNIRVDNILWLAHMSSLHYLNMSFVNMSFATYWLQAINMLPSLKYLDMSWTSLPTIPISLPYLNITTLGVLNIAGNNINSTLPRWLRNLTSITHLDLSSNEFHGFIPDELSCLKSLNVLSLGSNNFEGMSPKAFSNLCSLNTLDLRRVGFSGEINKWAERLPSCAQQNIQNLYFKNNELSGNLSGWLENMTSLTEIDLSGNSLNGTIPLGVWRFTNLTRLYLQSNFFEGTITEVQLSHLQRLKWLDLAYNTFNLQISHDWIPHFQLKTLHLASCNLGPKFPTWLQGQTQLEELGLSKNGIVGTLPNWLWNMSSFDGNLPFALCESTSLQVLDISNNKLSGEIPSCLGMLQDQLLVLDMMSNTLSGNVPTSLGKLRALSILDLSNNRLSGEIPSSLQYCRQLVNLNLGNNNFSGTISKWIGESLLVLMVLILRSNGFSGSIPSQITQLGFLRVLDLSHNNLSGTIPGSIGKLSWKKGVPTDHMLFFRYGSFDVLAGTAYLVVKGEAREYSKLLYLVESIDLSCNNLYGEIPDEIGDLQALQNLNLSMNHLTGHIPDQIGKMHELESLDVAINKLSGTIPQSLATLNYLSSLNVSYNNLSGKIPSGNQMQTLNDPSIYIGNPYLCGSPTTQSCSTNETTIVFGKESHDREVLSSLARDFFPAKNFSCIRAFAASGCFETERNALLAVKVGFTNPGNRLSSWEGQDCCEWRGVVCSNTTGHVLKLNLRNSYNDVNKRPSPALSGKISPSLLLLNHLKHLDLSSNNFNGIRIPTYFGSLKNLRYLNLSRACFGGTVPPQLGNLSNLHYLDINSIGCEAYDIAVDNFAWVAHLSSLRYLDMSFVNMSIATDWFQAINKLPSLTYLDITYTNPSVIPISLPHINITSLRVLKIASNNINSTIPRWIWNLTGITYLDLSFNQFHGFIPSELSFLKSLKVLLLRYNNFKGVSPKAFNNLCNLSTLDLNSVGFTGRGIRSVERLSSCTQQNLQILRFADNKLRGNLSGWLERMTSLTNIDLSGNSLNGTIPIGVWRLPNLTALYLESNFLEGVVTEIELSYLKRIKWLSLSYNSLHVQVMSHDWTPPFQLKGLKLASCNLGPKFPPWLQGQTQLGEINLSKTKIVDTLPDWLWNMSSSLEVIDLSYNQIKGKLPLSLNRVMLRYLNLSSNQFEGPLPALPQTPTVLDLSNNFFTGPIPNSTLSSLEYLLLSNNSFDGNVPVSLCESTSLIVLDISNNKLSGEIPPCLGMLQDQLFVLDTMNNNLSGQIPASLGKQTDLSILNLRNNSLSGEIPSSLQYCTELIILDLGYNNFSGTIPKWIGESLPFLMVLSLCSNTFSGSIPSEIVQLGYLRALDLSHNILSGSIPRSIGELSWEKGVPIMPFFEYSNYNVSAGSVGSVYLVVKGEAREYSKLLYLFESIDLSCNNLYGEIPDEIGDLQALQNLNLSINHLTGHIPDQIGMMHALESLDVAMNNLSGTIPQSLATLNYLSYLNVSYNNLSGKIPSGYQLQTLNDPSIYMGNPYLCGPPTTQSCFTNETIHVFGKRSHDRFERLGPDISVVLGFIIGFWIFCGVFLLSRSLRISYFSAIDRTYDRLYVAVALALISLRRRFREV
ncbi:LRR receptor-like serine/threonine-protein kinase GSO1 [Ananas comosus]|uniref:LRR receptor-like serine/threonine-protein kinase GSO1 n=1 Tax=Ananas comosus TaxID=4615 RepID=A0A6P5EEW0_ANACO|nr:LRR receptor-like serine/threonine-protein kinase GSO1 [Ananas comosus]